ncbi:MAG: PepSY domain-containing protein [Calditrichia bacterium]
MKWLFGKSRWIHKYFGLVLLLFLMWMSISGILLNHPELIANYSIPAWLVPSHYRIKNWDRSALITLKFSEKNQRIGFAAGKLGIWKTEDGGQTFLPLRSELPESPYYRKTNDILLLEKDSDLLFAATDGGLFVYNLNNYHWKRLPLRNDDERILKILKVQDRLFVFTPSSAFASPLPPREMKFKMIHLRRKNDLDQVSMIRLFFDIHDGRIWGFFGRLLIDFAGLIIIFISVTAFYIWFFPRKRKKMDHTKSFLSSRCFNNMFRKLYKYHLKIGIWVAALLLIIGGTGFFMRPPALAAIANGWISSSAYPGFLPENPWDQKIQNALYDSVDNRLIIQAAGGFWIGPPDFSQPFVRKKMNVPVFVMGTTVFEPYGKGGFLVGSFSGIYHLERKSGKAINLLTNREAGAVSSIRPAEKMITGYFKTPQGEQFITTHEQGLLPVGNAHREDRFIMPLEMKENYKMPLWNFLFEIHNGRIFTDLVGNFYILIVPLGSLLFVLVVLSGIYDWLFLKIWRKRSLRSNKHITILK